LIPKDLRKFEKKERFPPLGVEVGSCRMSGTLSLLK